MTEFLAALLERQVSTTEGCEILAVDGRSSSGKTTLADRLARVAGPGTFVLHTDDIAWRHSRFGWTDLLIRNVIDPLRAGRAVAIRPPAWAGGGRPGTIEIPKETSLFIIEGVGSSRRALASGITASVWVQADEAVIGERHALRVAAGETTWSGLAGWTSEEMPFLAADRPWERADAIVAGATDVPHHEGSEIVVAGW